ncbi:hypothetical protein FKM82_030857 [Ascaphus truei]
MKIPVVVNLALLIQQCISLKDLTHKLLSVNVSILYFAYCIEQISFTLSTQEKVKNFQKPVPQVLLRSALLYTGYVTHPSREKTQSPCLLQTVPLHHAYCTTMAAHRGPLFRSCSVHRRVYYNRGLTRANRLRSYFSLPSFFVFQVPITLQAQRTQIFLMNM